MIHLEQTNYFGLILGKRLGGLDPIKVGTKAGRTEVILTTVLEQ